MTGPASWKRGMRIYGEIGKDPPEAIADLLLSALSNSNHTRMVLIIDPSKRVVPVKATSIYFKKAEKSKEHTIGPIYRCGRNPRLQGITAQALADDIRETLEGP